MLFPPGGFSITLQLKAGGSDLMAYTSKGESPVVTEMSNLFLQLFPFSQNGDISLSKLSSD